MERVLRLEAITRALGDDAGVRAAIVRDYALETDPAEPAATFVESLLCALDQRPLESPLSSRIVTPEYVFLAAVNVLGSNSRDWHVYRRRRSELGDVLMGWDPAAVAEEHRRGRLSVERLREFFPGITGGSDARAVLRWAERLEARDFMEELRGIATAMEALALEGDGAPIGNACLMPCLAAHLANPPKRWAGRAHLPPELARLAPSDWKLPGMGATLASEFLRNMGFSGFKPDRHVTRLLYRWAPESVAEAGVVSRRLTRIVGRGDSATRRFLTYSLAGVALTPAGTSYSVADNLVWALGHYVEKKGRESDRTYVTRGSG